MLGKYFAGKNIESYCTRCKLTLDHTITAMEGELIAGVKCNTCGSRHKFISPEADQKVLKPRAKRGGEKAPAEILWQAGLAEAKGEETDYDMAAEYSVGDVVNHPVFGKGVVTRLLGHKCGILFRDKERLMVSANE